MLSVLKQSLIGEETKLKKLKFYGNTCEQKKIYPRVTSIDFK